MIVLNTYQQSSSEEFLVHAIARKIKSKTNKIVENVLSYYVKLNKPLKHDV